MAQNKKDKSDDREKKESTSLSDSIKKIISAGTPTDISKELLNTALNQVNKTKDDVTSRVSHEMISLIQKIDFVKEFSQFAQNHKFKISAEIEVLKKDKEK